MPVDFVYSEQFSYLKDEVLHILNVGGRYTIAKENTKTEVWAYTDIPFDTLSYARGAFDKVMEKAPSNTTELEILGYIAPMQCGWEERKILAEKAAAEQQKQTTNK